MDLPRQDRSRREAAGWNPTQPLADGSYPSQRSELPRKADARKAFGRKQATPSRFSCRTGSKTDPSLQSELAPDPVAGHTDRPCREDRGAGRDEGTPPQGEM